MTAAESAQAARQASEVIASLPDFENDAVEKSLRNLADEMKIKAGQLFGVLRIAITGQRVSPPLIESMQIIGKDEVLHRIEQAVAILNRQI
jgi:glutamyl-tRNA synthetase